MISKWGYVDSYGNTLRGLGGGVSLTDLNWTLTGPHSQKGTIHSAEEPQRHWGTYSVPSTALDAGAAAGNQTGDEKAPLMELILRS